MEIQRKLDDCFYPFYYSVGVDPVTGFCKLDDSFRHFRLSPSLAPSGNDGNSQMLSPGPDVTRTNVPLLSACCKYVAYRPKAHFGGAERAEEIAEPTEPASAQ
jgi:hypothetical protein